MTNWHFTPFEGDVMGRPKRPIPAYLKHHSGLARVLWNNETVVVGPYGSAESYARYQQILDLFRETGRIRVETGSATIEEVISSFFRSVEQEYGKSNEPKQMKLAYRLLLQVYGQVIANEFRPHNLRALREMWVEKGLSVTTVNMWHSYVCRLFKWAASHEMVDAETSQKLASVAKLSKVRSVAKPPRKILPVDFCQLEAIKGHVSRQVWAMILLQWHTGMRPGEAVQMRGVDLDTRSKIWIYRPVKHKTSYRGHERAIGIGPAGQEAIREFLRPGYMFSPHEATLERGKTPNPNARKKPGEHYTEGSYGRAVREACKKAGIAPWSPNRIRHAFATRVRAEMGLDSAQVALGHSDAKITQIYAERDLSLIEKVAEKLG